MSTADFDESLADLTARLIEFNRVECSRMAKAILDEPRCAFRQKTFLILLRLAVNAPIPTAPESRCVGNAYQRWERAARRNHRRAVVLSARLAMRATIPPIS